MMHILALWTMYTLVHIALVAIVDARLLVMSLQMRKFDSYCHPSSVR